jgi:hypothetical protein
MQAGVLINITPVSSSPRRYCLKHFFTRRKEEKGQLF